MSLAEMGSYGSKVPKVAESRAQTHRHKGHVTMKAGTGGLLPQAPERAAHKHPELKTPRKLPQTLLEERGPANTLLLGFPHPEPRGDLPAVLSRPRWPLAVAAAGIQQTSFRRLTLELCLRERGLVHASTYRCIYTVLCGGGLGGRGERGP